MCRPSSGERNRPPRTNDDREKRPRRSDAGTEETQTPPQRVRIKTELYNYSEDSHKKQTTAQKDKQKGAKNSNGKSKAENSSSKPKENVSSGNKEGKRAVAAGAAAGAARGTREVYERGQEPEDRYASYSRAKM